MRVLAISMCLVVLAIGGGCRNGQRDERTVVNRGSATAPQADANEVTGTVRYLDLEGGFYGIETDDGRHLDPVNLPEEFRQDGLRIRARVEELKDRVSFRMWGTLVRVHEIERLQRAER